MKNLLRKIPYKTVSGSIAIALSFLPQLLPYSSVLMAIGTGLAGVGVADKMEKIKEVLQEKK